MTWVKLDDTFPDHPKIIAAGDAAAWLWVSSVCFASRHLTDGFIPNDAVARLTSQRRVHQLVAKLLEVGLWEAATGGYWVHDYEEKQRTRSQVDRQRESARQRQRRHRSHAVTRAVTNGVTSSVTDAVTNGEVTRPEESRGSTSSSGYSRGHPQPVDDDEISQEEHHLDPAAILFRAVVERVATAKWERSVGANATDAYRMTVRADVGRKYGDRLRALIALHPDGPIECFAGELLGEPNSLHRYRKADA